MPCTKKIKKNGLNCKIIVWIKTKRCLLARIQQGWCQDQSPRWSRKGCEAVFLVHTCQRWTNSCNQWRRHSSASNMLLSDSFDIPKQKNIYCYFQHVLHILFIFLSLLQWFVVITMIGKINTKSKQEEKCLNYRNLHHHKNWDTGIANHHFCSSVP